MAGILGSIPSCPSGVAPTLPGQEQTPGLMQRVQDGYLGLPGSLHGDPTRDVPINCSRLGSVGSQASLTDAILLSAFGNCLTGRVIIGGLSAFSKLSPKEGPGVPVVSLVPSLGGLNLLACAASMAVEQL